MRSPVTPSLFTPNLVETIAFYQETLGFVQTGIHHDESEIPIWTELSLNQAKIWFFSSPLMEPSTPQLSGLIYLFVENVDQMAQTLAGKVDFEWGPETQDYGLREVAIKDCNGYYLVFAQDV